MAVDVTGERIMRLETNIVRSGVLVVAIVTINLDVIVSVLVKPET